MIPPFVTQELQALGVACEEPVLERCGAYLDLLLDVNQRMNLTAVRERDSAWRRLIIDSLSALPAIGLGPGAHAIDVGTGAGLPGIPLAIALPEVQFHLVDSTGKKIAFLESVVSSLSLGNVTLLAERVENLGQMHEYRETFDLAISRAVGPMPVILEYCLPLLRAGGTMLAMKGPKVIEELEQSSDALLKLGGDDVHLDRAYPETFDNELVLVRVTKSEPTPAEYPRLPGTPKREPL